MFKKRGGAIFSTTVLGLGVKSMCREMQPGPYNLFYLSSRFSIKAKAVKITRRYFKDTYRQGVSENDSNLTGSDPEGLKQNCTKLNSSSQKRKQLID